MAGKTAMNAMQPLDADVMLAAFDLAPGSNYLNSAGQTPRLRTMLAAGARALAQSTRPWMVSIDDWLAVPDAVRSKAARLFGCGGEDLALVPSVAYGSATAAANLALRKGQIVLTLAGEHPSAVNAWIVAAARHGAAVQSVQHGGATWTDAILAAVGPATAIVVVPACHWLDGREVDLLRVAAAVRAVGAALVVDATQAIGVLDIDLAAIDPDFLMAAGHKWLLGAPGLAYLYVAPRHQQGRPLEEHAWARCGGLIASELDRPLADRVPGAARFDASGIHAGLAIAMAAVALDQLSDWGVARVRRRLHAWQQRMLAELRERGLGDWIAVADHPHHCALRPPRADAADCQQLVDWLASQGIIAAARGSTIRISPYLHSSDGDAGQLARALACWQRLSAPARPSRRPRGP
jgi:selenocysteine lyase/cysteine desulfurase